MRVNIKYNDYTGFTFNGIHTSQLGLVRVSTGSRYQGNLLPSFQNFTETDGSIDGTYYFGKNNKSKSFNIDLAFDSVTEEELQEISQWLSVDIGELIFDELPFKKYYAKVDNSPTIQFIPFNEKGERIYKGEISFSFVCYDPYGYSVTKNKADFYESNGNLKAQFVNIDEWLGASGITEAANPNKVSSTQWICYNGGTQDADYVLTIGPKSTTTTSTVIDPIISFGGGSLKLGAVPNTSTIILDTYKKAIFIDDKIANNKITSDYWQLLAQKANTTLNLNASGMEFKSIEFDYKYL